MERLGSCVRLVVCATGRSRTVCVLRCAQGVSSGFDRPAFWEGTSSRIGKFPTLEPAGAAGLSQSNLQGTRSPADAGGQPGGFAGSFRCGSRWTRFLRSLCKDFSGERSLRYLWGKLPANISGLFSGFYRTGVVFKFCGQKGMAWGSGGAFFALAPGTLPDGRSARGGDRFLQQVASAAIF